MIHRLVSGTTAFFLLLNSLAPAAFAFPHFDTDTLRAISTRGGDAEERLTAGLGAPDGRSPARGSVPGVYSFLAKNSGPYTQAQLAEAVGLSPRTIETDLRALTSTGILVKFGEGSDSVYHVVRE